MLLLESAAFHFYLLFMIALSNSHIYVFIMVM